jgi:ABC-2 type transport system ATP-binding protein
MASEYAIHTNDLGRIYQIRGPKKKDDPQKLVALEGVNLSIERGGLFGLLGPNGAGKTTLIKILSTLLLPTKGSATIEGLDVTRDMNEIRRRISMVSGGETSGYGLLTIEENLWMFARFHGLDSSVAKSRINEMLDVMGILDRRRTKISDLSTGLRQKMNFVRGFITDPDVIFLDEPTLGLDVSAAREVRNFVKEWLRDHPDRTILLTTHYMAEAEELCDRLAIIDKGRLLVEDTTTNLKRKVQDEVVFILKVARMGKPSDGDRLEDVAGVKRVVAENTDDYTQLQLSLQGEDALPAVLAYLAKRGSGLIALEKREPSLEEVFIQLVGRTLTGSGESVTA